MRKIITILAAAVALSSCSITKYLVDNEYLLSTIENNVKNVEVSASRNTYSDDIIDVAMSFGDESISFTMVNNSNSSIKILWDDAAYMDQYGDAHRIIHTGVRLVDKEKAQVPSIIPRGAKLNDGVVPANLVNLIAGNWVYEPLSKLRMFDSRKEADEAVSNFNPVRLLLPIETNGVRYEYTYTFENKDAKVIEVKQHNNKAVIGLTLAGALMVGIVGGALFE